MARSRGELPRMMKAIKSGESVSISGTQEDRYQPIYIEDIARLTIQSVQHAAIDPEIFNMAGLEEITWSLMAQIIGEEIGIEPSFNVLPEPRLSHLADLTKMRKLIGDPAVKLREGIHRVRIALGY